MSASTTTAHISKIRPVKDWHIEVALFGDSFKAREWAEANEGIVMVRQSGRTTVKIPLGHLDEFEAAAQAAGFKTKSMRLPKGWYRYIGPPAAGYTFAWGARGWAYSLGDGRWLGYIWKAGCHPDRPWRGVVIDGGYEPRFDDLEDLSYFRPEYRGPMRRTCGENPEHDVRAWAKRMGIPVPCAHWHVEVVPIGEDPGENWTDAEPEHPFPEECPWIDGEILSPYLASDIAGMDPDELEEISSKWQVVVEWHDEEEPFEDWKVLQPRRSVE